ncbi:MAG: GtrA family protein [Patescibacteria group bacterium]
MNMFIKVIKFGLVGLVGVVVGFAVITAEVEWFHINPRLAWYFSTFLALLSNFFLNNFWTWSERSVKKLGEFTKKIIFYYLMTALTVALNFFIYNVLLNYGWHYLLALGIAIIICAALNFAVYELIIWPTSLSSQKNTENQP